MYLLAFTALRKKKLVQEMANQFINYCYIEDKYVYYI